MSPQRWEKLRAIFDQASEAPTSEVEEVLRRACAGDESLYQEVRRMLAVHERTSPLDRAVWDKNVAGVFAAGQTVSGRYKIVRYISRGGMGEVYEAQDLELGERVALKTLLPEIAGDSRMILRFKQEIQLSRKIGHPNVCRVFDLARHPADGSSASTVFFLTMEFLAGETLSAKLEREGRMTSEQALPLVEQMGAALDAAHRAGVVHRDLKPSNVMLTENRPSGEPRAVITDFGLARSFVPQTDTTASMSGRVMGTVDYMAPELLTGAQASFASDIYALGMVVFKMVTGALPFASDTPLAAAILRAKEQIPSPKAFASSLDVRWERAILRALHSNPARRFPSAAEFVAALRGDATNLTLALPVMTRRRWTVLSGIVVLAVAGAFAWRASSGLRGKPSAAALTFYEQGVDQIHNGAYYAATRALTQADNLAPSFPLVHARLAEAWLSLEAPEKASREMVQALSGNVSSLSGADRLQLTAIGHLTTREYAAAVTDYQNLVADNPPGVRELYLDLGTTCLLAGKQDQAIQAYRKAAEGEPPEPAAWMWLGMALARAAKTPADIAQSEEAFQKAEDGYKFKSNLEGITALAYHRALAAGRRGDREASNRYLRQTIDTARLAQNAYFEIAAKTQMSINASAAGDGATGEKLAREALETAQANQLEMLSINSFLGLATARLRQNDAAGAEKYYRDAHLLAQRNNSLRWVAQANLWLAALHDQMHLPGESAEEASLALSYFQPQHWQQETLRSLTLLARAESSRGQYEAARGDFEKLLATANAGNDPRSRYLAQEGLASVYANQENYPQALNYCQEMRKSGPTPEQAGYAALRCGRTWAALGNFPDANRAFDEANAAAEKFPALRVYVLLGRAEARLFEGRNAEAAQFARQGLAPEEHANAVTAGTLRSILGLALLRSGKRAEGATECEQALAALKPAGDPSALATAQVAAIEAGVASDAALEKFPESNWRALALLSRAEPARQALAVLQQQWPADLYRIYLLRPDVNRLARPLLARPAAKP